MNKILYGLITLLTLGMSQDCILQVPDDPLNTGLFKPWFVSTAQYSQLPCSQAIPTSAVFVEATILNIDTGDLFVYSPLVIDVGSVPAIQPLIATLPINNSVILNMGTNGKSLTLINSGNMYMDSLQQGNCVNGVPGSIFGQVAFCNGINFFQSVNTLIQNNFVKVPPIGNSNLGDICPTTRSFSVVDQDQSDNVITQYLLTNNTLVAQDYPQNTALLNVTSIIKVIGNGSDNRLLANFIDLAIGCIPFMVPDLAVPGILRASQALNEIQANLNNPNDPNTALVPSFDPMCLVNGFEDINKTNAYRQGMNQPILNMLSVTNSMNYCNSLLSVSIPFYTLHQKELTNFASPDNTGSNLLNFLSNRLSNTWANLNCNNLTGTPFPLLLTIVNDTVVATNLTSTITTIAPTTTTYYNSSNLYVENTSHTTNNSARLTMSFFQLIVIVICICNL